MSRVVLNMSLANVGGTVKGHEFYGFIEDNLDSIATYKLEARGRDVCAAIEYNMILGAVGSVASVASLLWMAYDKFIGSKKKTSGDDAGLYIAIVDPDGTMYHFWLGNEYKDRDIFIEKFTERVEALQADPRVEQQTIEKQCQLDVDDLMERRR